MILGKPNFGTVLDLLRDEGCPLCGELPTGLQVNDPNEIALGCGHVVDAKDWIDANY